MSDTSLSTNSVFEPSLVFAHNNHAYCTSLMIAEKFEKNHADVLRAIRDQMAVLPEDFTASNFAVSNYKDSTGRTLPMFELTRDGFSFIVMGFTGEKAVQWKIKFLEAFNAMESQLRSEVVIEKAETPKNFSLTDRITAADAILSKHYEGNQLVLALDKVHVRLTGESVLKITGTELVAPQQQQLYTPTELGKSTTPILSAIKVNKILASLGWQIKTAVGWEAVGPGLSHAVYLDTGKAHSDGTPIRQLKWTADAIFAVQGSLEDSAPYAG